MSPIRCSTGSKLIWHADIEYFLSSTFLSYSCRPTVASAKQTLLSIYTKWNERLFEEMYAAYEAGRSDKNPAEVSPRKYRALSRFQLVN